jgi:hypothetical protein
MGQGVASSKRALPSTPPSLGGGRWQASAGAGGQDYEDGKSNSITLKSFKDLCDRRSGTPMSTRPRFWFNSQLNMLLLSQEVNKIWIRYTCSTIRRAGRRGFFIYILCVHKTLKYFFITPQYCDPKGVLMASVSTMCLTVGGVL